jgi:hypothetical protein
MPRVLNGFVRRLTTPAYSRLLCRGIEWIHRAVTTFDMSDLRHERDFELIVINALMACWERHHEDVAANPNLRQAFQGLLTEFASQGSHAAISLRDKIVESIGRQS